MGGDVELVGCDFFFFQAEDGIRDLVRSRGLGDVYKRQSEVSVGEVRIDEHCAGQVSAGQVSAG